MKFSFALAIVGVICAGCHTLSPSSAVYTSGEPARLIQEIQRIVPSVSAPTSDSETLAFLPAHFSNRNSETERLVGPGLSGEDLYLFPDRSYMYLQWADIMPPTIYDKGTWLFESGVVSLQSDHSVRQRDFPKDRHFAPLFFNVSGKRTLLLMGTNWDFSYYKEKGRTNDNFMLFLCTLTHNEPIEQERAETLKKRIYVESWHPEFFTK